MGGTRLRAKTAKALGARVRFGEITDMVGEAIVQIQCVGMLSSAE
jgi:hypothetical protein